MNPRPVAIVLPSGKIVTAGRVTEQWVAHLASDIGYGAPYNAEDCGICKKAGAKIWWPSAGSLCVHEKCYALVFNASKDLEHLISRLVITMRECNLAHIEAVKAVEAKIRESEERSIYDYLEKYGAEALKKLFDTEGRSCVQRYHERMVANL